MCLPLLNSETVLDADVLDLMVGRLVAEEGGEVAGVVVVAGLGGIHLNVVGFRVTGRLLSVGPICCSGVLAKTIIRRTNYSYLSQAESSGSVGKVPRLFEQNLVFKWEPDTIG